MQHYKEKQQEEDKAKTEEEIEMTERKPIIDFLKDINYESMDSSLGIQLKWADLQQREKEVSTIY